MIDWLGKHVFIKWEGTPSERRNVKAFVVLVLVLGVLFFVFAPEPLIPFDWPLS